MHFRSTQQLLPLPESVGHGGRRENAGRKPVRERAGVSHHGRPAVSSRTPVHVTLRVLDHVWNLRSRRSFSVIEAAIAGVVPFRDFRVVHFGVEGNHLHLIVEADHNRALAEGMQGLTIRLAKGLNRLMGRRGRVFADRYHAHVLKTPAEVRNAIAYVLLNHRSHAARRGEAVGRGAPDRYSSAFTFDGWKDIHVTTTERRVTSPATSWLLTTGWRLRGLIRVGETPALREARPRRSARALI
jgi:REP element-mobilizing transposase RayT